MATAAVEVKIEECPICTEEYRDALVLECGHHFCRVCLEEIATGHPDGHVTCPTCRHITNTTGKDDISKLQKYSMVNHFVGSVNSFETLSKNVGTDPVKLCDICQSNATNYCEQCRLVYCEKCLEKHDLPEHKVYIITDFMFCKPHKEFAVSYCQTCNVFCCGKCVVTKHNSHIKCSVENAERAAKEKLQETSKELETDHDEEEILKNVRDAIDTITEQKAVMTTGFKKLERTVENLLAKVKKVGNEIHEKMDAELKNLRIMKTDLSDLIASKVKLQEIIDNLLREVNPHEVIAKHESLPAYSSDMKEHLFRNQESQIPELGLSFEETIQTLKEIEESLSPTLHDMDVPSVYKKPITDVKLIKTFQSHQTGGYVLGIVADIEKKELVIRGDKQEPIIIYDYDGNKKRTLGIGIAGIAGRKWQGIDIDTKHGLYVLPVAGDIMLIDKQGNKTGQFKVSDKNIHDICYNKGKDVYVTSSHSSHSGDNKVYIINASDRSVLSSFLGIPSFGVASGQVNVKGANKHVIAVTGYNKHCVKVYDFQGNVLYTAGVEGQSGYTDGYLYHPWGFCIDPKGRILVCNESSKKVVSVDDKSWKQLISVTHESLHVTFDPSAKRLFVAGYFQPCPISMFSY